MDESPTKTPTKNPTKNPSKEHKGLENLKFVSAASMGSEKVGPQNKLTLNPCVTGDPAFLGEPNWTLKSQMHLMGNIPSHFHIYIFQRYIET